ncbi:MAG: hypothetical protein ACP5P3_03185 [Ignavibacteria bacterium]
MKRTILIFFLLITYSMGYTQFLGDSIKTKPRETKNNWGLNLIYGDKGFGLSSVVFYPLGKFSYLSFGLGVSGVADNREFEQFDIYGNSYVPDKEKRIFLIPLNIGIQYYIFKDDIEGNFKPLITGGIAPALILTNPYDKGYFEAFKYFNAGFAFGPYIGIGLDYNESSSFGVSFDARFYYLPVLTKEVNSLKNRPIKDVGGFQLKFGVIFLK